MAKPWQITGPDAGRDSFIIHAGGAMVALAGEAEHARLIAQAPALLGALQSLLAAVDATGHGPKAWLADFNQAVAESRRVVAAAEGEGVK